VLVKYSAEITVEDEVKQLNSEIETLDELEDELEGSISESKIRTAKESKSVQSLQAEIARIQDQLASNKQKLARQDARMSALKESIKSQPVAKSSDVISDMNKGEETYLFGLKVVVLL
jgi:predicted  nucleic acid-binding Zn-ribbon protein